MTYGFRSRNGNNQINIDEQHIGYVHLLTAPIASQTGGDRAGYAHVTFTCAGFPLVFFDVPYNVTAQDTDDSTQLLKYRSRTGIAMVKLTDNGSNSWTATFLVNNHNGPNLNLFARIFGRAHLNYPSGSGMAYGFKVRDPDGNLVFDAGLPMLRLGADTYDTEISLDWRPPGQGGKTEAANAYDTAVNIGSNLEGASICATSRGLVYYPFPVSDVSSNFQYYVYHYASLYWANGSTLYARRIAIDFDTLEGETNYTIDNTTAETVYSRVAIIGGSGGTGGFGSGGGGPSTGAVPVITTQPNNNYLDVGDTATFSIVATGAVSYQWRKNGVSVPSGGTSASYTFTVASDSEDQDQYTCAVTNNNGVVISNAATLYVDNTTFITPTITEYPQDVTVVQNGSASMSVDGTDYNGVSWYRNNVNIFGSSVLTLNLQTSVVGVFTYKVRLFNGSFIYAEATATLTVTAPTGGDTAPVFSDQPDDVTTPFNTAVSMSCAASPVTSYQWKVNGSNVSGATSSSFSPNVSVAGVYSVTCVAINGTASTVSDAATLTVEEEETGGGGTGEFSSYQNLTYREDQAVDASVAVSVSKDEGWGIGTGDPTLYSVRATGTGNTSAIDSGTQQLNTWYSFASYDAPQWTLNPPFSGNGSTNSVTLSFQIKLNSTGTVVSIGSGLLQATYSGD